ncbi:lactosylceramide 4-alpha-galactosyltransferase-like [Convolutriloba macropyga]|uniref:lactosylceramide 4-alpha-galactosyltransferase-like n=1 Tax=Convolutriloba macropyga TaxID=536237 RepID=UPI003F5263BE
MSARRTQKLIVLLIVLAILYFFAQNNYLNEDATDPSHEVNNNQQPGSQNSIPSENLCGKTIELPRFPAENVDQNRQIFFVETNVQPKPRGRTICALESAIRIGKMPVKVFFRSSVLTVNHPALCSLVKEFYPHKLSFYTTAIEELFERSPLQGITKRLQWNHPLFLLQLSDLMRAVMLYKYGGFYLDQDVLTLRDLTGIRNSIVTDNITSVPSETCKPMTEERTNLLNQGTMHFDKENPFLLEYLRILNATYRHGMRWIDPGPVTMHLAAQKFLGRRNALSTPLSTPDLTIVPSFVFRLLTLAMTPPPPPMFDVNENGSYFEDYVRCSYVFHLTGLKTKGALVTGNPRHDVYSYFGPKVCPTAISHLKMF